MYPLIPIYEQCMEKKKLKRRVVGYERERERGRERGIGYKWVGGEIGGGH